MNGIVELSDKLRQLNAMLLTCSFAMGNRDAFCNGPKSVAIVLDYIGAELDRCCICLEKMSMERGKTD